MKICVITATRAEFGILSKLIQGVADSPKLELQLVATGAHLLEEFGATASDIRAQGFAIDWEVHDITQASSVEDVSRQVGAGVGGFTSCFLALEPDAVVILGDRYEMLSAAIAAFFLGVPIVHLHGGEVTHGAFDDGIRHSITKFARVHCVANTTYANRVIRAGESPDSVHVVGGFGVDKIAASSLLSRLELERDLGLELSGGFFLVTYHPVTSGIHDSEREIAEIIQALEDFPRQSVVFTMPNADPEHRDIALAIETAVKKHRPRWAAFSSLGSERYLSLLSLSTAVVGNSSSGLTEAPSLGVPAVNIGPRQRGRVEATSVVSCEPETAEIVAALHLVASDGFQLQARTSRSPYGLPGAADLVVALLESIDFGDVAPKQYYDGPTQRTICHSE